MTAIPLLRILAANQLQLDKITLPEIGPDDLLLQVAYCGICGSDISYLAMGGLPGPNRPMPIGHEFSGRVSRLGSNVKHLAVGDRVVVNPEGSGNRIGNSGPEGAFSPYVPVRRVANSSDTVFKLPDAVSLRQGALVEPLSVAMHAVHQAGIKHKNGSAENGADRKEKVVVLGAGPIGLGIVLVLQYYGVKNVAVVDLAEQRLQMAEQLGATAIRGDENSLAEALQASHGRGELMGMPAPGTDIYFEATGVSEVFDRAVSMAKPNAKVVVVGVHKKPVQFDLLNLLMRELQVIGSMAYTEEFPQVIAMLQQLDFDASRLISHCYPLAEFQQAFATAQNRSKANKVLIAFQHEEEADGQVD